MEQENKEKERKDNKNINQKEVKEQDKKVDIIEEKEVDKMEENNKKDNKEDNEEFKKDDNKENEKIKNDEKEEDKNERLDDNSPNKSEQKEEKEEKENKNEVKSEEGKKEEEKNIIDNKKANNKIIDEKIGKNTKTNNKEKNGEITQQDIDYLCKYMNEPVYQRYFLIKLNNYRTLGIFEMPLNIFNYVNQIFCEILKYVEKEKKYKLKENIFDIENTKIVIILSQTFYCTKGEKKIYLQKELQKENIFKDMDFWKKIIKISIEIELKNYIEYCHKRKGESESDIAMKEKKTSIVFAQILPYINSMNEFGVNIDEIKSIITPFIKEYEISEDDQKVMLDLIEK